MQQNESSAIDRENTKAEVGRRGFLKGIGLTALAGTFMGMLPEKVQAQSTAWTQMGNNNHLIELQEAEAGESDAVGDVAIDYYGHCAFKITSPNGVTMMFDPWRNDPSGAWGLWFPAEFPKTVVDIGMSTHAHFDHDAVEQLEATMLLDRMVGQYQFSDVKITGIADKHACVAPGWYSWTDAIAEFGQEACPPNNPHHMDMAMYLVETGGLRILIWGDNRPDPPQNVWDQIGQVDVLTLPVDGSQHILSYDQGDEIVAKLNPGIVVPTHYLCEGVSLTLTTLQTADEWVDSQKNKSMIGSGSLVLNKNEVQEMNQEFMYFESNTVIPEASEEARKLQNADNLAMSLAR